LYDDTTSSVALQQENATRLRCFGRHPPAGTANDGTTMTVNDTDLATVLARVEGRVGRLTLNRPEAINALDLSVVVALQEALDRWAIDPDVDSVVLDGAGDRGLCAGGDIVSIYQDTVAGGSAGREFFRAEYTLNATIGRFPKPYVAIMDGIVMGGGVGVSAHGNVRVVTERTIVSMPETGIGFVPDVGGTYLLSRAPGEIGTHLGLTAGRMTGTDAIALGFADHFVPSESIDGFITAIVLYGVAAALTRFTAGPGPSPLVAQRNWIDEAYAAATVEQILERLERHTEPEAHAAADALRAKSPVAVKATLHALRMAREAPTLEAALNTDFRTASHALRTHDMVEGIRAQVVEKDRNPKWSPACLADVDESLVAAYFAPVPHELGL
jgi:enoyl-CoA hydratase